MFRYLRVMLLDTPNRPFIDTKPVIDNDTHQLECALKGFYSFKYFQRLSDDEKTTLKVNNITNAYAENAINRIGDLAKTIQAAKDPKYYGEYFSTKVGDVQTKVVQKQIDTLEAKIATAEENSNFLEFQRRNRNRVQARLLTASDAACDLYKRNLNGNLTMPISETKLWSF